MWQCPTTIDGARFHKESARCMCGSPFEDVRHILHLCPLWKGNCVPSTHLHLAVFVRFLKANPRAFEFPGANLEQESGARNPGGVVDKPGAPVSPPSVAHPSSGAPPQGASAPPRTFAERNQVISRRFGGIANVTLLRRAPLPRAGRDSGPKQSDICMFFSR